MLTALYLEPEYYGDPRHDIKNKHRLLLVACNVILDVTILLTGKYTVSVPNYIVLSCHREIKACQVEFIAFTSGLPLCLH